MIYNKIIKNVYIYFYNYNNNNFIIFVTQNKSKRRYIFFLKSSTHLPPNDNENTYKTSSLNSLLLQCSKFSYVYETYVLKFI